MTHQVGNSDGTVTLEQLTALTELMKAKGISFLQCGNLKISIPIEVAPSQPMKPLSDDDRKRDEDEELYWSSR